MLQTGLTGASVLVASEKISTGAEVTGINRSYKSIDFNPGRVVSGFGERTGWGLRLIRNGKLGVSGKWGVVDPFRLVDRAITSCRYGPEACFSFPQQPESDTSDPVPETSENLTHETVRSCVEEILDGLHAALPLVSLSARMEWGEDSFFVMNSSGMNSSYSRKRISCVFSVTVPSQNGLLQAGYSFAGSGGLPAKKDVLDMLLCHLNYDHLPQQSVTGKMSVVFSPSAFSVLLQAVRSGVSAKLRLEGASPLAEMVGEQVLSSLVTIRDLPRLSGGAASAPFDSEGIPTRDKTLFNEGVFTGFLHDLASAAECGTESTGSSGRNIGEHSRPVCTNLVVDSVPGNSVDTLAETGSGIFVPDILSAAGGNTASGSFVLDCGRVYQFRRGEIFAYYDGCVLTGNVYDALSRVKAVGGKQYRTGADMLPFISLDGISVS